MDNIQQPDLYQNLNNNNIITHVTYMYIIIILSICFWEVKIMSRIFQSILEERPVFTLTFNTLILLSY